MVDLLQHIKIRHDRNLIEMCIWNKFAERFVYFTHTNNIIIIIMFYDNAEFAATKYKYIMTFCICLH